MNIGNVSALLAVGIFSLMAGHAGHAGKPPSIKNLQGLYTYRFPNGLMDGTRYISENKFLLIPVSPDTAYFAIHLEWANGHSCDVIGVAEMMGEDRLLYTEPSIEGKICRLSIKLAADKFVLGDAELACRLISCGTRGGLDGVEFHYEPRRPIRPEAIKQSPEYLEAMAKYKKHR